MKRVKIDFEEFIELAKKEIAEQNEQDNHCIIMYKLSGRFNEFKYVHKVYKNIDEYAIKGEKDADEIDEMYGVNVQVWYFD